ncbi:MAG TPA: hypothetical protein VGQ06_03315 [Gemmatimonadales bacterium]|jgi:hypothetical protein|nr:hypothetical protein [Gemmatimonadales bacterium]
MGRLGIPFVDDAAPDVKDIGSNEDENIRMLVPLQSLTPTV